MHGILKAISKHLSSVQNLYYKFRAYANKPVKPPQCKYVELNGLRVLLILSLSYVCSVYYAR